MQFYFTADYHLGHQNSNGGGIIEYCNRPYKNVEAMNRSIIDNHNSIVKPEDTVFHIGDFCFKNIDANINRSVEFEKLLNGKIIHIQGNHDNNNSTKCILYGGLINYYGHEMWMVHDPKYFNKNYKINLVGHVHTAWKTQERDGVLLINVGVDVNNYRPISGKTIHKIITRWMRKIKKR